MVKNLPAKQETWVRSLGQENPLEKEMAAHTCVLAWEIPWTEEPGGLQSVGLQRLEYDLVTKPTASPAQRSRMGLPCGGLASVPGLTKLLKCNCCALKSQRFHLLQELLIPLLANASEWGSM